MRRRRRWCEVLKKIYQELVIIRKELQAIRNRLEPEVVKAEFVSELVDGKLVRRVKRVGQEKNHTVPCKVQQHPD